MWSRRMRQNEGQLVAAPAPPPLQSGRAGRRCTHQTFHVRYESWPLERDQVGRAALGARCLGARRPAAQGVGLLAAVESRVHLQRRGARHQVCHFLWKDRVERGGAQDCERDICGTAGACGATVLRLAHLRLLQALGVEGAASPVLVNGARGTYVGPRHAACRHRDSSASASAALGWRRSRGCRLCSLSFAQYSGGVNVWLCV